MQAVKVRSQEFAAISLPSTGEFKYLGKVMEEACQDDPSFRYILPDAEARREVLPWFFTAMAEAGHKFGIVLTTPDLDGAAIWLGPGHDIGFREVVQTGLIAMPFKFGWSASLRAMHLNALIENVHEILVSRDHWYLVALAVRPSRRGRGIGSALMQPSPGTRKSRELAMLSGNIPRRSTTLLLETGL